MYLTVRVIYNSVFGWAFGRMEKYKEREEVLNGVKLTKLIFDIHGH